MKLDQHFQTRYDSFNVYSVYVDNMQMSLDSVIY